MKKKILLGFIFLFITIFTFNSLFYAEKHNRYSEMINIGETNKSNKIVISNSGRSEEDIYKILKLYLNMYNGNLYCSETSTKPGKSIHTKYIYISNADLFKDIRLSDGRFLDVFENESDKFLSTENLGDSNQIGQIEDFVGNNNFEIRTIKNNLDDSFFNKNLIIQLKDPSDFSKFVKDLEGEDLYIQILLGNSGEMTSAPVFKIMVVICFFVLIMLIVYHLLNSYKKIGIEKMLGYSKKDIWLKGILSIISIEFIVMCITTFILIFVNFKVYNSLFIAFIINLLKVYILMIIFTFIFVSIPFLYVKRISISNMLKNKRPVKSIVCFNIFIKILLSISLVLLSVSVYKSYKIVQSRYSSSYETWEDTKEYAIVTGLITKGKTINDDYSVEQMQKEKELFLYFNKKGAIYANFQSYAPDVYELNLKHSDMNEGPLSININPNYLNKHTIYDENGQIVSIDETETELILLVPKNYKSIEDGIRKYYESNRSNKGKSHADKEDGDDSNVAQEEVDPNIKIIWTSEGQNFFSYRLDINPGSGNCITDPVAVVITESNGSLIDYYKLLGYNGSPFKFKVDDISNPAASILDKVKDYYDMSIYSFPISSVYDNVKEEILEIKREIRFLTVIITILISIIMIITVQNIYNYFEQHKVRLAVQRFNGYKTIDKYKGWFLIEFISFLIILTISSLIMRSYEVLWITLIFFTAELIISLVFIRLTEKRNILRITKGG